MARLLSWLFPMLVLKVVLGISHPSLSFFLILFLPSLVPSLDLRKTWIGSASDGLTMPSG